MTSATPEYPQARSTAASSNLSRSADPELIEFGDDPNVVEDTVNLFFQQLGGRELINLVNKDIINSINPNTSLISNLFQINIDYNPQNLVPLFNPANEIINSYALKFNDYVPEPGEGTGPAGSFIYIDDNGDLVINLVNLQNNEKVEVQILNNGTVFGDTIYAEENEW